MSHSNAKTLTQPITGVVMDCVEVEVNELVNADCDGNICVTGQPNKAECAADSAELAFLELLTFRLNLV